MLLQYTADGLLKQDDQTLRDTQEYIDQLLTDRERRREEPVTEEELPDGVDVIEEDGDGTVYHEYRTCGDDTCHCLTGGSKHGPYVYRAYHDGNTVRREYLEKLIRMTSKPPSTSPVLPTKLRLTLSSFFEL